MQGFKKFVLFVVALFSNCVAKPPAEKLNFISFEAPFTEIDRTSGDR